MHHQVRAFNTNSTFNQNIENAFCSKQSSLANDLCSFMIFFKVLHTNAENFKLDREQKSL